MTNSHHVPVELAVKHPNISFFLCQHWLEWSQLVGSILECMLEQDTLIGYWAQMWNKQKKTASQRKSVVKKCTINNNKMKPNSLVSVFMVGWGLALSGLQWHNDLYTTTTAADTSSSHRASRKPSGVLLELSAGMCGAHHSSIYSTLTVIPHPPTPPRLYYWCSSDIKRDRLICQH